MSTVRLRSFAPSLILIGVSFGCGWGSRPAQTDGALARFVVEVDQMQGTPLLEEAQEFDGRNVSLAAIFRDADIELEVEHDQADLPRADSLRLADLHALMTTFRSNPGPKDEAPRIHLLVVTADVDDPRTLGIMFDFGSMDKNDLPREGFALFANAHSSLPGGTKREMLLTAAHELAHVMNLHHTDWDGASFWRDATIESYSLTDTVRWTLSERSKDHIRTHDAPEVWPGPNSLPFGYVTAAHADRHQSVPGEAYTIVDANNLAVASRGAPTEASMAVRSTREPATLVEDHPLKLHLHPPKTSYLIGEPVVVTVGLHNESAAAQDVVSLLDPFYRLLTIEVKKPGSEAFEPFRPAALLEARPLPTARIEPGEAIHEDAKIFFGATGWMFTKAGKYAVRADYPVGLEGKRIASETIEIEILEPTTPSDVAARNLIVEPEQGLFMLLDGADHLREASQKLQRVVSQAEDAVQSPAVKLALGLAALQPTIASGARSAPRIEEARRYLDDVLESQLSPLAVATARVKLTEELQDQGRTEEAAHVGQATFFKFQNQEAAKASVEPLRRYRRPER